MLEPIYDKDTLEEGIIEALRHIDAFDDIETAKAVLRSALSPNESWAINLLNSTKSDGMKFHTTNDFHLPFYERMKKPINERVGNSRLCVVYQVWGNHNYLKFLYLSILSQIVYTDMLDYDVKVFLSEGFINDVGSSLLARLLPTGSIVKVKDGLALKYGLTTHPHLQNYDVVSVVDTDAFWYNPTGKKTNIYGKMLAHYDSGYDGIIMAHDGDTAESVFWSRRETLNSNIPKEHYKYYFERNANTNIEKLDEFLENENWYLSCLFVYGKKHFKEPDYAKFAITCLYDEFLCDETVWMMWGFGHDYEVNGMDDTDYLNWVGASDFKDYWENRDDEVDELKYIHPVQGDHCYDMVNVELYDEICEKFSEFTKKDSKKSLISKLIGLLG